VRRDAGERHYVWASRAATMLTMVAGGAVTFYLDSVRQAWEFVLESGAGIGLVLILRWYWWRVNAWSEIAAMIAPAVGYAYLRLFTTVQFPYTLIYLVAWTSGCWLLVTFVTPPETDDCLLAFYRRVRPGGPGWRRIAALAGGPPPESLRGLIGIWAGGWILVYAMLFGTGTLILYSWRAAVPYFATAAAAAAFVSWRLRRRGWRSVVD